VSESVRRVDPVVALSAAHAVLDDLLSLDLSGLDDGAMLDYWRDLERLRRRIPAAEHGLVREAEARGLPDRLEVRSVTALLRGLLRLDPGEAAGRVRAAEAAGPRRALTGEPVPAICPAVAGAQAGGEISERHARTIVQVLDRLPDAVQAEHGRQIETDLVGYGAQFDPHILAKLGERILAHHDPDGPEQAVQHREKRRDLTVTQRVDGSSRLTGELTAEATELLLLHCDALAKPRPEVDGVKDPRTAGQRRHDALLDALKLNLRAQQLPSVAGVTATIVLTMTAEQFEQRRGVARTAHGALVPVPEACRMSAGEYRLMTVVIDKTKGITAYSSLHRLHTEQQRLALAAVDGGCTFPDCSMPAPWCEVDHVIDHAAGGPTSVESAVLACRYENNTRKKQGWRSARINGRAAWIPPTWIDPEQKPRYNHLHNLKPPP
jgi:hypothetical protein